MAEPCENWLSPARIRAWATVLLIFEILIFAMFVAGAHGWIVTLPNPTSTDFVSFHAAGSLAWAGTPELAYDMAAHYAAEQAATEPDIPYQFFFYPPVFLLLLAPLSRLPYLFAYLLFEGATLALYCFAVKPLLAQRDRGWWIPVLAYPAVFWTLGLGQNSLLTAALLCFGLRFLEKRPVVAGLLFGLLCYKPHIGVLIPVALLAGRHFRACFAAALTVGLLVAGSVVIFGLAPWQVFLEHALSNSEIYSSGRIDLRGVVTPFAFARLLGFPASIASLLQAATGLAAAVMVWFAWRRPGPIAPRAATLLAATLLAAPVLLLYDLMIAHLAMVWMLLARRGRRLLLPEALLVVLLFLSPLACRSVAQITQVQIAPLVSVFLLVWAFRNTGQRTSPSEQCDQRDSGNHQRPADHAPNVDRMDLDAEQLEMVHRQ